MWSSRVAAAPGSETLHEMTMIFIVMLMMVMMTMMLMMLMMVMMVMMLMMVLKGDRVSSSG